MRRRQRLFAVLAIAAMCAPGTWLRSPLNNAAPRDVAVVPIGGPQSLPAPDWRVARVWRLSAKNLQFGGFSALLPLADDRLSAFSDRGYRMTFSAPGQPEHWLKVERQPVAPRQASTLSDSESATRGPASGDYWLGFEQVHTIHRYTSASRPDGLRKLSGLVDWPSNSGIEAMVRLADGRFVVLPEGGPEGLIFAGDPVEGGAPARFRFRAPVNGYVATDLTQLPDGRLLVLMRKLVFPSRAAWPPFSALLAIGDAPEAGSLFAPSLALRLDGVIPRENYEGLALRPRDDGLIDVWVMADDNFSLFQRSLLVQLAFDPRG